jgi:uncharacterized protein YjdB
MKKFYILGLLLFCAIFSFSQKTEIKIDEKIEVSIDFKHLSDQIKKARTSKTVNPVLDFTIQGKSNSNLNFKVKEYALLDKTQNDFNSFEGQSIDKTSQIKFVTFKDHIEGIVKQSDGYYFFELSDKAKNTYIYYKANNKQLKNFHCGVEGVVENPLLKNAKVASVAPFPTGANLRTFKFAAAATGEMVAVYGSKTAALNKIVSIVNAANLIYESELSIRFQLIAKTLDSTLIFSNAATDPFNDTTGDLALRGQNGFINMRNSGTLPYSQYDIGHTFNTYTSVALSVSGVAGPSPCDSLQKSRAWTEWSSALTFPGNLGLILGVFVHEVGHQFGAFHSFNASGGNIDPGFETICTAGWSPQDAIEPGSGSTLMAYGANCFSPNNYVLIGQNTLNYFHTKSLERINTTLLTKTCFVSSVTGNTPPVANAGADITIPKNTPFILNGIASDANNDVLNYTWEQYDIATANDKGAFGNLYTGVGGYLAINSITAPLFRSSQTISTNRSFPSITNIIQYGNQPPANNGENLPNVARNMKFRFTVRDNKPNGGGVDSDEIIVAVSNNGPLSVTAPDGGESWASASSQTITWAVNGTNAEAANVKILLSIDGGYNYGIELLASTPNDGSQTFTLPVLPAATKARIKIVGVINTNAEFFDISNANFTITSTCLAFPTYMCNSQDLVTGVGSPSLNFGSVADKKVNDVFTSKIINYNIGVTKNIYGYPNSSLASCATLAINQSIVKQRIRVSKNGLYKIKHQSSFLFMALHTASGDAGATLSCSNFISGNCYTFGASISMFSNEINVNLQECTDYYLFVTTLAGANSIHTIDFSGPGDIYEPAPETAGYSVAQIAVSTTDNLIKLTSTTNNFTSLPVGTYKIYTVSYVNTLTISSYLNSTIANLLNANCVVLSQNFKNVTVNCTTPPAAPTTTSDVLCGGGPATFTLSASGCSTGTLKWYDAATLGNLVNTGPAYSPTLSASTSFYVACENGACISNRATVTATIIETIPSPLVPSPSLTRCGPGTFTLTASGCPVGNDYNWYDVTAGIENFINSGPSILTASLSANKTYSVRCSSPVCGEGIGTNIDLLIGVAPTISGTLSVCSGGTTQLAGSGTAAASNPWQSSNTAIATVSNTGLVTGISMGTADLTYKNVSNCTVIATVTISAGATITGTLTACIGGSTTLTGSPTANASTPWISSNTLIATVSNTGVVTGVSAGTAVITYKNTANCTAIATITISSGATITGPLTTCIGKTATLTGSGTIATTTPWVSSNTSVATISSTGVITPVTTGTTTITYKTLSNCTATALVTIIAAPIITGTINICVGNTTTLTGTGTPASSNPWISATISRVTITSGGVVSAVSVGSSVITYTNSNGCTVNATVNVTAAPTITGSLSACIGATTTLIGSASPNASAPWVTSNPLVATVSNTGIVTGISAGTAIITYKNTANCTVNATVTISSGATITGTLTTCIGKTVTLVGSGTPNATNPWVSSAPTVATVSNVGLVTPVAVGTTTITYKTTSNCTATATITIIAAPTISGILSACVGATTTLTGSGSEAITTPWTSSITAVATVSSIGVVTGVSAGTSTITYTNSNGCTVTAIITINANPIISGTLAACVGGTTSLSGSGTAALTNPWSSSSLAVATVSAIGLVNGVSAGNSTITFTNNLGCVATANLTINPNPTITGSLSACVGTTSQLTGSGSPAAINAWLSSTITVATVSSTGLISGISAGTSTISYTNLNNCIVSAIVTINPKPTISGTLSACVGATTTLTGSGSAAITNPWTSSNTAVATVSTAGVVTGVSAGTSTITFTNSNGCFITASITINPAPTITGTLSACVGATTTLTGSAIAAASSPWLSTSPTIASVSTAGVVTGLLAGTSLINYTNSFGCSVSSTVTINALPTISGTLTTCIGATTILAGSGISASANPWTSSNTNLATVSTTGVVTGVLAGTVNIVFQNSKGCTTSASVIIKPIPVAPIANSVTITAPQVVTLNATGCTGGTINWYNAANANVGTGNSYVTPTSISVTTVYSADCNLNGCVSSSKTPVTITFSTCPQNIIHATPITAGTYQAAGTITSTVIMPTPTRYKAANSITLSPGFKADSGVLFEAIIAGCN